MTGENKATVVDGLARDLAAGGGAAPVRFELRDTDLAITLQGKPPIVAAYRDLTTVAVDQGMLLVVVAGGAVRLIAEQLGAGLGSLVAALRELRARQQLTDRLIDLPDDERLELVEYRAADFHGVALIAYHPWGVALLPIDERHPWRMIRRADLTEVRSDTGTGSLRVTSSGDAFELLGLGARVEHHRARLDGLRQAASADAATIVARLLPDAHFPDRQAASALLVDGRPVGPAQLAGAWALVERAVLADPTYAATFRALVERTGASARRWLAIAPLRPNDAQEHMAWFFVALPNGLVALELVSEGSHATYLFRAGESLDQAVMDVSNSLIDTRFLREPIYLTPEQLADPAHTRYRFAIAALPALQAARARFVTRLIHTDEAGWSAALDQAITSGGN